MADAHGAELARDRLLLIAALERRRAASTAPDRDAIWPAVVSPV